MDSSGSLLRFSHLTYQVKTKGSAAKVLVDDVSVVIKAGELLAIMVRFA
jgi:ABC-type glutathione transport system ATPase component